MKVSEIAARTGKSARALRLYEERGLLTPSSRSPGGFRLYGADQVRRVQWISRLQDMGFSLAEIDDLVHTVWSRDQPGPAAMDHIREVLRARAAETRAKITRLMEVEREITDSVAYLEACRGCDEPRPACLSCTRCDIDRPERHSTPATDLIRELGASPEPADVDPERSE